MKDIVLVGGGHSHVAVLKCFGMKPLPGARLTIICRDTHTPYSGMLPGFVAGHYDFDDIHIDLAPLARFAGARFYRSEATGLDTDNRRVLCRDRSPVPYDVLSINIGATPRTADVPGAMQNAVPLKPISRFVERWEKLRSRIVRREGRSRVAVVGAGPAGVEILLAIQHRLRAECGRNDIEYHLFDDSETILPAHNESVRRIFRRVLEERHVVVHGGQRVLEVTPGCLRTAAGHVLDTDEILWATAADAASWPREAGLAVDERGFIEVAETLQSVSHEGIFAAGDIACMVNHPRPKAGVFAVRQGPPLERNLRRALLGTRLERYVPQARFLSLISTGDRYAVASRGEWCIRGRLVWRWKDRIDRQFIRTYSDLPGQGLPRMPDRRTGRP